MAAFSYKKTTNTALKASGILDSNNLTIACVEKDGDEIIRSIPSLLSDFNGQNIAISITLKTEEELEEPGDADALYE